MLDLVDETFDEMSFFVNMFVVIARVFASGSRRNDGFGLVFFNYESYEIVGVISLVAEQPFEVKADCQCLSLQDVMLLPRGKDEAQRIAETVDGCMNFCAETSSAAP